MARLKNGPNGGFSGKVGSVVGSSWKGIEYIRGLPRKRRGKAKPAEANNRTRFGYVQTWLNAFSPFTSIGFMNSSSGMLANNAAMSWNVKNAVKGEAPDFYIDYQAVLLSDGILRQADEAVMDLRENVLTVTWKAVYRNKAKRNDDLLFLAYDPVTAEICFELAKANRNDEKFSTGLPPVFKGKIIEVYIAFTSRDRKIASRSQYLGSVLLPGSS